MDFINDFIYNYKHFIIFVLITLILNIIIFLFVYNSTCIVDKEIDINKNFVEKKEETEKNINIDIKGAIKNPGVYTLKENTLVKDAIDISGGLLDNADTSYINLSMKLTDEMVIIIYTKEEIENISKGEAINGIETCKCPEIKNDSCIDKTVTNKPNNNNNESTIININTASLQELLNIPGVGEVKAKAIIEYREKNLFKNINEITNVTGIGESTFEKIKDYITT